MDPRLQEILSSIEMCITTTKLMEQAMDKNTSIQQLRLMLRQVSHCIFLMEPLLPTANWRDKVVLCLSQIRKILLLYSRVINTTAEYTMSKDTRWYLSNRMQFCLNEIACIISADTVENEPSMGAFISGVDSALQMLAMPGNAIPNVEPLLCQALTIAKLSNTMNANEITSGCQQVIKERDKLQQDRNNQLNIMTMTNAIELLERRVNTAVLVLFIQIFSDSLLPLRDLVEKCKTVESSGGQQPRKAEDLESLISGFDIHCERIVHVAMFAINCSNASFNHQCIFSMRCCIASLESLEDTLVPALIAFYMDSENQSKRLLLKTLSNHWSDEIVQLETLLHRVIDTAAMSKIIHEEMQCTIQELRNLGNPEDVPIVKRKCDDLTKRGKQLLRHIKTSHQEKQLNTYPHISSSLHTLQLGVHESNAACSTLLDEGDLPNSMPRIIKRCELIQCTVETLADQFEQLLNDEIQSTFPRSKGRNTFCTSSLDNSALDFTNKCLGSLSDTMLDTSCLDPFISRAAELSASKTTLYGKTSRLQATNNTPSIASNTLLNLTELLDGSVSIYPDMSTMYDSPQRIKDLKILEDKIKTLRSTSKT
uniref:Serendipity locus protein alpha n=1 Tax=Cacopsylla melanoneura TaxID=428564 RepID=A0A8D8Q779_9HEMI